MLGHNYSSYQLKKYNKKRSQSWTPSEKSFWIFLNAGLIEMIKWFSLAARKIVPGKMKLPKQTQKFMDRHQDDVRKLASAIVDPEVKRSIILKP